MLCTSIAWAESSRIAATLAARLGASFHLLSCPRVPVLRRFGLYRQLAGQTREILNREQPDVVVVQNPPIHAVAAVADYARRRKKSFVIDAHSFAFLGTGFLQQRYRQRFALLGRNALVTLIHNEALIPHAGQLHLRHLVLEMAVPDCPVREPANLKHPAVVVVCGYGRDEPVADVLRAARLLPDVHFYLTGNSPGLMRLAPNVAATGFLAEPDYWKLLGATDVVMALTTREATILSAAYEGLSVSRPLVLSRTATLAKAFNKGAVLVENRPDALVEGVRVALARGDELQREGQELRAEKAQTWDRQFRVLQEILAEARKA